MIHVSSIFDYNYKTNSCNDENDRNDLYHLKKKYKIDKEDS